MNYLLDTHAVHWSASRDPRLPPTIDALMTRANEGDLAISDVTLSELACLLVAKKIHTEFIPLEWLQRALRQIHILPVTPAIALRAAYLDWPVHGQQHRDPADRHIVATAIEHRLPLITGDRKMHALARLPGLKVIW